MLDCSNVYGRFKVVTDWLCALILLALTAPLLLLTALAVKLTSRGPILYSQVRLGRGGKPYSVYKIRTMIHDCERHSGVRWSTPGDPRVTLVGRFLRKVHIDELPQLWNVLRGEMSLVGPRPERPEFIPELEKTLPHYRDRLHVRPGMSGLAQVQLPPDSDLQSVRRKLAHDLYYVRKMAFWLDFRILLCTAFHLVGLSHSLTAKVLLLPGGERVERTYPMTLPTPAQDEPSEGAKPTPENATDEPAVTDLQVA